ncbi:MAG: DUF1499 domain-containing protein [Rhodobacteraceae bacterium]|nr:DUF1499 domain-containing protein [Paracoccaceae bacterium]MCF8513997.1 DUF1499 domain-containing protein [Paracoccaceae bacterium]MCF8518241.1 DUF1499 domain-containing protein [Paracoccaceae bacterium]
MRTMLFGLGVLGIAVLGAMAYVRLAPTNTAQWHSAPAPSLWDQSSPWDQVVPLTGAASLRLSDQKGAPTALLAKIDAIAMATPRTTRLAGSVGDGMITWQTRSALWGFPDFTTAEVRPDGLYLYARLRFGTEDLGVNAKRLTAWLAAL